MPTFRKLYFIYFRGRLNDKTYKTDKLTTITNTKPTPRRIVGANVKKKMKSTTVVTKETPPPSKKKKNNGDKNVWRDNITRNSNNTYHST